MSRYELKTTREIAEVLRVSIATVRRMVKAGRIPCIRAGRQLRFRIYDVLDAIDKWRERR
jgi:excisionase family DNA binding protein